MNEGLFPEVPNINTNPYQTHIEYQGHSLDYVECGEWMTTIGGVATFGLLDDLIEKIDNLFNE